MSEPLSQLTAAVLVGGIGSRLRAVVPDQQKVIAPVAGRPFLMRILDQLADAGVHRVVLCTGHKADQVSATIGARYRNLTITYSPEPTALGTAGAFRNALPFLNSDPVIAMNGDSYCEVDLAAFSKRHHAQGAQVSLVVTEVADTRESGRVEFNEQCQITNFTEKGKTTGRGWINAGIYLLTKAVLESIPVGRAVSIERETFPAWVGHGLYAFRTTGKFLDIGTPAAYAAAQDSLL